MRTQFLVGLFALWVAASASHAVFAAPTVQHKIDGGVIIGAVDDGVESYKGLPYAAPPVGPLRWRAPQAVVPWTGIKSAERFGFACMQPVTATLKAADMSEDCLTLNVFRPASGAKKLPVMVWIHGGSMTMGASSQPAYDGTAFAKGGVVLVSINYRLGALGLFAHPALTAAQADGGRLGNYALMDQIATLQWVKRNIAAFGGDPNNVTVFGESAGAVSVEMLMIAPEARGLFHRAIAQSASGRGYFHRLSTPTPDGQRSAEAIGIELASAAGAQGDDLAALRAVPAEKLVAVLQRGVLPIFILDGKVIPNDLWATFRANKEAPVPFLLGSNSREYAPIEQAVRAVLTPEQENSLTQVYGGADLLKDHLTSDILFTEQVRALARFHAANGYPTYVYLFAILPAQGEVKGTPHGYDVRFVFGSNALTDPAMKAVSDTMNGQWRAFATAGAPNGQNLPLWPRYDGQQIMEYTPAGAMTHPEARSPRLDALSALLDAKSLGAVH